MKVAYLITRMDSIGGAQIHVRDLSLWLTTRGHEAVVLTGLPGETSDFLQKSGVAVHIVPSLVHPILPGKDILAFREMRHLLREVKPDLVSCHSSKAGVLGRLAATLERIPVVHTAHGWAFTDGVPRTHRYIYEFIEKVCAPACGRIITVCEYDRQLAASKGIARLDHLSTIHNGMPLRDAAPERPASTIPRIVMVARFGPQKDHVTLLNALFRLSDLPWEVDLIGGGDNNAIVELSQSLGLHGRVTFHGQRTDTPDILDASDLFVLLSHWEGFPRSILEAMRASLPVIASEVAGVPEAVVHGETGLLVPRGDVDAAAIALRTLLTDTANRTRMGKAGRKRFLENFTFSHMAEPTLQVYADVLKRAD